MSNAKDVLLHLAELNINELEAENAKLRGMLVRIHRFAQKDCPRCPFWHQHECDDCTVMDCELLLRELGVEVDA